AIGLSAPELTYDVEPCPLRVNGAKNPQRESPAHVRFAPKADELHIVSGCPLCAISRQSARLGSLAAKSIQNRSEIKNAWRRGRFPAAAVRPDDMANSSWGRTGKNHT